jgi:hypothetical protein
MLPDTAKDHNDVIDLITTACNTVREVPQPDGSVILQPEIESEIVWWKTHLINSPYFGRFALILKRLQFRADDATNHMAGPRALGIRRQIYGIIESYKRSIDAKSSESRRDENNAQSTLIDKINRNKIEKIYSVKGEAKKSFMSGMLGRDGQAETQDD